MFTLKNELNSLFWKVLSKYFIPIKLLQLPQNNK